MARFEKPGQLLIPFYTSRTNEDAIVPGFRAGTFVWYKKKLATYSYSSNPHVFMSLVFVRFSHYVNWVMVNRGWV